MTGRQQKQQHLRDDELLLLGAGELPWLRRGRAQKHLAGCGSCRERELALDSALAEAASAQRHAAALDVSGVRSRMIAGMSGSAVQAGGRASAGIGSDLAGGAGVWAGNQIAPGWQQNLPRACVALVLAAGILWSARFLPPGLLSAWSANRSHDVALPIRQLTPGATRDARLGELCGTGDPDNDRVIDSSMEQRVFHEYGLPLSRRSAYEVDFLITPGLGGSRDIRNLWPEPYESTVWNAHVKNRLETHLHQMVCAGQLPLATAQAEIAADWISAYKRYFHTELPAEPQPAWQRESAASLGSLKELDRNTLVVARSTPLS